MFPSELRSDTAVSAALELLQRAKTLDSDDSDSSDQQEPATPPGKRRFERARVRLRHHLDVLLTSSDVNKCRHAQSLLEMVSVQSPTRKGYREIMLELLALCDRQTPPADVNDPGTADVALCAFGNDLYAHGHHKSSFERAVAVFLFHLPEFGRNGS